MRSSLSLGQLAAVILTVSPLAAAWSPFPALDSLVVRQDASTTPAPPKQTSSTDPKNAGNLNTGKVETAKPTGSDKSNSTATKTTSRQTFDSENYPASIVMLTPAATNGEPYYSMGQEVTLSWNYTGLLATPTALNVQIEGKTDSATYTVTSNMTFPTGTTAEYRWDTRAWAGGLTKALMTEEYVLRIYDADGPPTATGEPGYLAPFMLTIGLYEGKTYQSKEDGWICSSCSGVLGASEQRAIGMAVVMSVCTVASFTWFVTGTLL